ncbi:hypothetical protein OAF45_00510 [Candidatus Latescibacteria bacterium]|nr:hypothetical protein [Candidatus Latescibacterota bacterium]
MKKLIAIIALVAMAQSASAGDISATYTTSRPIALDESYDSVRLFLIMRLKKQFAEYAAGSIVVGESYTTLEGATDATYSIAMGRIRTEIIKDEMTNGRIVKIKARFWMSKDDVKEVRKRLQALQNEITPLPLPYDQYGFQSDDGNWDLDGKVSRSIYTLGGLSDLPEYGNQGGVVAVVGAEYRTSALAFDLFGMVEGNP